MQHFFMVEFELPSIMAPEFLQRIPEQKIIIDEMMAKGKIRSYSLSENRSKLWIVFIAENEFEVMELINQMPLSDFMIPSINLLMFHNSTESIMAISLN